MKGLKPGSIQEWYYKPLFFHATPQRIYARHIKTRTKRAPQHTGLPTGSRIVWHLNGTLTTTKKGNKNIHRLTAYKYQKKLRIP